MRAFFSTRPRSTQLASIFLLVLFGALQSCQAPAPRSRATSRLGDVRADSQILAEKVAGMVDELQPLVVSLLPDSRDEELDVWVQKEPMLYRFLASSYEEADGFWAEAPGRIHLRRDASDLKRTLAHELTHATLGPSWRFLPGTIEEGLCDCVSVDLCPESAAAMRAGRLSAACFAIGGLELELALTDSSAGQPLETTYSARILLQSGGPEPLNPMEVFEVSAGLSTTSIEAADKKAFYGLAYLVVDRILSRHGVEGLHELCLRAERENERTVKTAWLLDAAGLDSDPESWQRAIAAAIGPAELEQLVMMYPRFVSEAMAVCKRTFPPLVDAGPDEVFRLSLSLPECEASVLLTPLGQIETPEQALATVTH